MSTSAATNGAEKHFSANRPCQHTSDPELHCATCRNGVDKKGICKSVAYYPLIRMDSRLNAQSGLYQQIGTQSEAYQTSSISRRRIASGSVLCF